MRRRYLTDNERDDFAVKFLALHGLYGENFESLREIINWGWDSYHAIPTTLQGLPPELVCNLHYRILFSYKEAIDTYWKQILYNEMTIQEKIGQDLKEAMFAKDETKKSLLRVIIGEFNRVDKIIDDSKATAILKKMLENATDPKAPNPVEAEIIYAYLPQQLTTQKLKEVIALICEVKNYTSIKDMGKIMAELKAEYSGQYDGKVANELIKNYFNSN